MDGRGDARQYVPWNATEAQGLLNRSASKLAGVMLCEEVKASKVGFTVTPGNIGEDFTRLRAALALAAARAPGAGNECPRAWDRGDRTPSAPPIPCRRRSPLCTA